MRFQSIIIAIFLLGIFQLFAQQDSVDVVFFHKPAGNPQNVWLPGEFNGWVINNPVSLMSKDAVTGIWSKTVRLRVGGPNPLPVPGKSIPGAYQYKVNEDGNWLADPLNPRQNPADNNNSYLFIRNPTIHYLFPNSTPAFGAVRSRFPAISAYIFPALSDAVDTAAIVVKIDGQEFSNIGSSYDPVAKKLSFTPPVPLGDGEHELILIAQSVSGSLNSDTTSFTIEAGVTQILSRPAETRKPVWRIQGAFFDANGGFDTTLTAAQIIRADSTWTVSVSDGRVDTTISLLEGENAFQIQAEINGQTETSEPVVFTRLVNHSPFATIEIVQNGSLVDLSGAGSSDPDSQLLTYLWREDADNPEPLGISGQTSADVSIFRPTAPGDYFVELRAIDPDNNIDSTRAFFTVITDSLEVDVAGFADNPEWVKNGRIYLLFFKAFTPEGTIQAAISNLDYIKAMGFNIIWTLPVMDVPGSIDNQTNIGYNIIDFFNVDPSLGTNADFQEFIDAAHQRDIKVILDITPNHTGRNHPFAVEARFNRNLSPFWNYYQTVNIPHNTNDLGLCQTPEGIYYYCAFSDDLLNYNWGDLDAREYMIDVYKHWVGNFDIDGFRFDIYWGPHRKYGEDKMGIPVREALKHIKPDILLLGEDDGTGVGTEVIYADRNGGLDVAYDAKLYFNAIRSFSFNANAVNTLHNELANDGFYPGENSYFLRFMENQDEDRISYVYDSFIKTKPMATVLFTAPGMPQMLNGQEVGFGKDMGNPGEPDLNDRRRGVIDWSFGGKDLLQRHYQRIAQIRAQFPAFSQHKRDTNGDGQVTNADVTDFKRVTTGNGIVYAFSRPFLDENGLTVVNFSGSSQTVTMNLANAGLNFAVGFNPGDTYWVNNLYADTSFQKTGSELENFSVTLDGYGSAVFVISTTQKSVEIPPLPAIVGIDRINGVSPNHFQLRQNYPNPFNPATTIEFQVPVQARVKITIFNLLGQQISVLADKNYAPGEHRLIWDARSDTGIPVASGFYFVQMKAKGFVQFRRMLLVR